MKKIATYIILLATLGSAACTRTDEFDIPLHQGSELVVKAELVSASDWKTRSGASSVAQDIEYGQSAESSDGQFLITATRQEWTAEQTDSAAFYPSAPDVPITRGTPITSASGINNMQVNVFQTKTDSWTTSSTRTATVKATRSGSGYTTSPTYSWVVDPTAKTSLFAYSPVVSGTNGLTESENNKIKYTVPTTVANQPDLCTAAPKMNIVNSDGTQQIQSFALKHQLTAVGFSMLGWNLKITKITVSGVAVVGTLTMNTNGTTSWITSGTNLRDVGVTQSSYTHNHNSSYANITTSSGYLMMIPQTLTDAATVTINYASTGTGSASGTTTAKLKDIISTWSAGDKITYNIRLKTAPAVTSGDLTITSHKAGYTTSSPMTFSMDSKDNLTFTWNASWLKIHRGPVKEGNLSGGADSGWSTGTGGPWNNIYFFATNDHTSTTTDRTATITVSGTRSGSKTFDVRQAKAPEVNYIPTSVIKAAGWSNFSGSKGLQVAMRGYQQMPVTGTAQPNDPVMQWKTVQTITVGVDNNSSPKFGTGKSSTDAMIKAGAALHPAAKYCREMGPEWYLPSRKELELIYANKALFGPSYAFQPLNYWNASEYNFHHSSVILFSDGGGYTYEKTRDNRVRCVREI